MCQTVVFQHIPSECAENPKHLAVTKFYIACHEALSVPASVSASPTTADASASVPATEPATHTDASSNAQLDFDADSFVLVEGPQPSSLAARASTPAWSTSTEEISSDSDSFGTSVSASLSWEDAGVSPLAVSELKEFLENTTGPIDPVPTQHRHCPEYACKTIAVFGSCRVRGPCMVCCGGGVEYKVVVVLHDKDNKFLDYESAIVGG
ncbi:hypothetical protein BJX99DRAFT_257302 [Aspergillus californicus]